MWKLAGSIAVAAIILSAAGFSLWIYRLPPTAAAGAPAPLSAEEATRMVKALQPKRQRPRPLIAVIGINDATETTDYVMPYGILRRADVADVVALATGPGPVRLFPALTVEPEATLDQFNKQHPIGADYIIVPAMSRDDDPDVMAFLKDQAGKGAIVIGVCAGAKVVAAAGLLDGKHATTHWYYLDELRRRHPSIVYVADRRIVVDGAVATTTGISASTPIALTLIEAIAGHSKAAAVAGDLGLEQWRGGHRSDAFKLTGSFVRTVIGNALTFWRRDRLGIEMKSGIDEVSLALVADAWSRTYRSHAVTYAAAAIPVATRSGLRIIPDRTMNASQHDLISVSIGDDRPAKVLDDTLATIGQRYGGRTADVVAMQLEYLRH
ncbi:MAG: DJ-1/PfpI family protein [Pseudolabrys sp.]|nr:DJ-1/PfpI family protein [Pseudolabrys sp.]